MISLQDQKKYQIHIFKKNVRYFKFVKLFNQLKAQGSHVWNPNVEFYRFKTLRIETEFPTSINIDGENLGTTPIDIKVLPSAIKVFNQGY